MNSICISGKLREAINDMYRVLEYELPSLAESETGETKIVCKYWTNQGQTRLHLIENNTRVLIKGHLDGHKEFGTILIVEFIEIMHQ